MQGEDVKFLQRELAQLGFLRLGFFMSQEMVNSFFGDETFAAVLQFQEKNHVVRTGVVDNNTAARINKELDEMSQLLSTTLPDPRLQGQFLTQYMNHQGCIEEFWSCLSDSSEFKDHVEDLQFTLQLGTLTGNHLPLIQELQRMRK